MNAIREIKVDEALWASRTLPEGMVERWFIADGAIVASGDLIAALRIENALHDIVALESGRLTIVAATSATIEPGSTLATIEES
jgi:pyruvate/2-oxoglutarate dehydrogenase complex dihydrolipoamide acyltransferase (E2) component